MSGYQYIQVTIIPSLREREEKCPLLFSSVKWCRLLFKTRYFELCLHLEENPHTKNEPSGLELGSLGQL